MKTLIIGKGRHGKDTVAEILEEWFDLNFISSSWFAAEKVVYPLMSDKYSNVLDCFNDRHNHRIFWRDAISEYNNPKDRLCKEILAKNDCYVGMRCNMEYLASKPLFDHIIYVDASKRILEKDPSMNIPMSDDQIIIYNNGSEIELTAEVIKIWSMLIA